MFSRLTTAAHTGFDNLLSQRFKLLTRTSGFINKMSLHMLKSTKKIKNRLGSEKSPYLLQHAHNPVEWYPWGDEAIERAKKENKLIFLSVGYSTCHWCHVMEKESFMSEEVASIMNENFVNIKVDREERPDIDQIYMNFVVKSNGNGGWPMSVWITPDLAPIAAGTYFPPTDQWGRPSFKKILLNMAHKWKDNSIQIKQTGKVIIDKVYETDSTEEPNMESSDTIRYKFEQCIHVFRGIIDEVWGGFTREPKFPEVSKMIFLMHVQSVEPQQFIYRYLTNTLKKMDQGGIHDHIFGGFSRYSVDRRWHVPHFEKMLYDQGQLMMAYATAYKWSNEQRYLDVAHNIFKYVTKDLQHPLGGFFSGEDADSLPSLESSDKIEGAFYAWEFQEIEDIFKENTTKFTTDKAFLIYCHYYSINESGNVEPSSDPHGNITGKNIFIVKSTIADTASKFNVHSETVSEVIKTGNEILYGIRCKRPRPHLDTKIVTSWNGLLLSGISQLSYVKNSLHRELYLNAAHRLVGFINQHLYDEKTGTIYRACYGTGTDNDEISMLKQPIRGFLDDYAFLIKGLLDYYQVTGTSSSLLWARELQDKQDELFWDDKSNGYFQSEADAPNIIVRMKDTHDGAEPSGNSVSARNLILLSMYFEKELYRERAEKLFSAFGSIVPFAFVLPEMMSALMLNDRGVTTLTVCGEDEDEDTKALLDTARSFYVPGMIIVHKIPSDQYSNTEIQPKSSHSFKLINNKPAAYLCDNKVCEKPITSVEDLRSILASKYMFKVM